MVLTSLNYLIYKDMAKNDKTTPTLDIAKLDDLELATLDKAGKPVKSRLGTLRLL